MLLVQLTSVPPVTQKKQNFTCNTPIMNGYYCRDSNCTYQFSTTRWGSARSALMFLRAMNRKVRKSSAIICMAKDTANKKCLSACLSVCPSVCQFVRLSVCLSVYIRAYVSICLPAYLPPCLSIYQLTSSSVCLYLSLCRSVRLSVVFSCLPRCPNM